MLQEFNRVMEYIEEHLTEEIVFQDIAKITGVSDYHFRRMFAYLAGMSLSEYIRIRRLSKANEDLIKGDKVTSVALKYNYQSVDGFSRAFKEWSGYLPSVVINNKIQKTFKRFSFFINIQGGDSMEFKIEKKDKFNLVGVTKRVPIQFNGQNTAIMELANSITNEQRKEMHLLSDMYPHQVLNASYQFDHERLEEKGELVHLIGFASTKQNPYNDLEQIEVAENTWAIFPNKGVFPNTLQDTWAKIYSEWLPSSNYELVSAPEISFTIFDGSDNLYSEIWIAIKEKK